MADLNILLLDTSVQGRVAAAGTAIFIHVPQYRRLQTQRQEAPVRMAAASETAAMMGHGIRPRLYEHPRGASVRCSRQPYC